MNILSTINRTFSFFAINSKGQTCIDVFTSDIANAEQIVEPYILKHARTAQKVYEIQIRRAFGLNFFLSFIPFTDAFKARIAYLQAIENLYPYINKKVNKVSRAEDYIHRLTTTPFYFLREFFEHYIELATDIEQSPKIIKQLSKNQVVIKLPFLQDLFILQKDAFTLNKNWAWNLLHTLINPLRIVLDLFNFMHSGLEAFAEIGLNKQSDASLLSLVVKYPTMIIFIPVKLLITSMVALIDLIWTGLYHLTISPFHFLYEAIKQAVEHFNQDFVLADIYSLQGARVIRKLDKDVDLRTDRFTTLSSQITSEESKTNQYLVHSKRDIYTRTHHTHELTVIATSSEKAAAIRGRIQFFDHFQQTHPEFIATDTTDTLKQTLTGI
ncbi:MAG: hypothetical protein EPN84_02145 [Legionella sp.]|nr:MAG: hypothetical protein EPN84_02145 [Legionella sp.]